MSDNKTKLLEETLSLFSMMGVREGQGQDGRLMSKIIDELSGNGPKFTAIEIPKGRCPLCGAANMMDCDCDPMEQLAASQ
jgi:hypothetical protein